MPNGPVSWTGLQVGLGSPTAPTPGLVLPPAPVGTLQPAPPQPALGYGGGFHSPFLGVEEVKDQALSLIAFLNVAEGQRSVNAYWANGMWGAVDDWEAQLRGMSRVVAPDIKMLLSAQGYVGRSTLSPPRDDYRLNLEALKATGAPRHGASAAVAPQQQPSIVMGGQATMAGEGAGMAFHNRLPPDLRRAGPEIYRSIRAAGSRSVREWINLQFHGDRNGTQFVDLWGIASDVDMRLGAFHNDADLMRHLASDDGKEIALRRLAAFIYEDRTHDKAGARAMLAVAPP